MTQSTILPWIEKLKSAKKAGLLQNDRKKVHYTFDDQTEMVEEYDAKTNLLLIRKWRQKPSSGLKTLASSDIWTFEIGQSYETKPLGDNTLGMSESTTTPLFSRNDKNDCFEIRIRNLPYPVDIYQLTIDKDKREFVLRTTNKKYFKRFSIADLDRLNLPLEESNLAYSHANNTLIITYKKPKAILDFEKTVHDELKKLNMKKEGDSDCAIRTMLFHRLLLTKYNPSINFKFIRLLTTSSSPVQIEFKDGFANISVPLPSRGESCVFQLKPFNTTIGDFVDVLQKEDRGIDRASIFLSDGSRLSRNSPVELMFEEPFTLRINETSYNVQPPTLFTSNKPARDVLSDVSNSVTKLYHDLRLNQYVMYREHELEKQLAFLRESAQPLNELHHQLANKAIRRLKWVQWSILAAMSFQTGVLFRLVWIDYSWDIMEPFTYFISYSAVFMAYCYYILRRHDMKYMNMSDYFYLKILHRLLRKKNFDLARYNALKNEIMIVEHDLQRLKDPLDRIVGAP
ncbi:unnamed protein product [Adineta steineri]|uniref:Protein DPCD n=1 Tax=Adineta steineri TaxID=433720 RepID=A0A819H1W9_9BILA|nr:unnamed protein product [Adineta steineri]CAF0996118.1 unnamed protein product [Adineta steineri]CAF1000482.1 unnamed protein product [Adineta steineri]CAF3552498.1 unnamed protein product [Adineta steineri]CAF3673781.1 unnamed protein product [Adineta steineri]